MRFITILLLLIVFFFGGMSYGSFEREKIQKPIVMEEIERYDQKIVEFDPLEEEPIPVTKKDYPVHKTATFFEKIVTALYELVVQIMYNIANLFFD